MPALAAAQAAENIAAADDHHHLHSQFAHFADLLGHVVHGFGGNADAVGSPSDSPLSLSRIRENLGFLAEVIRNEARKTR